MVATVYTPARNWRTKARHVTAIAVGRSLHEEAFGAFVHAGGRVLVLDPAAEIPGCTTGFSAGEAGRTTAGRR